MADPLSDMQNEQLLDNPTQQQAVQDALKARRRKKLLPRNSPANIAPSKIARACGEEMLRKQADSGIGSCAAPNCVSAAPPPHQDMPPAGKMPVTPSDPRVPPPVPATVGMQKGAALPSLVGAVTGSVPTSNGPSYGMSAWKTPAAPQPSTPHVSKISSGNGWSDSKSTNVSSSPHMKMSYDALQKAAAGGVVQNIMQVPGALSRAITAPLSMPLAATEPGPDNPRAFTDAYRSVDGSVEIGRGPHKGKHGLYGGLAGKGQMEMLSALHKADPKLLDEFADYVHQKRQEASTGAKFRGGLREFGHVAGSMAGFGPIPALLGKAVGDLGELGRPRHVERALAAEDPTRKPGFMRRWLLPRSAGAENLAKALRIQNPEMAERLRAGLEARYNPKPDEEHAKAAALAYPLLAGAAIQHK